MLSPKPIMILVTSKSAKKLIISIHLFLSTEQNSVSMLSNKPIMILNASKFNEKLLISINTFLSYTLSPHNKIQFPCNLRDIQPKTHSFHQFDYMPLNIKERDILNFRANYDLGYNQIHQKLIHSNDSTQFN